MSSDTNKATVRRLIDECWSQGKMQTADELITADAKTHDPTAPTLPTGPAAVKQLVGLYRGAFPDLRMTVDQQIAEGDYVVTRWTGRGTHSGAMMGIAPTQAKCTVTGIQIDRVENGRIRETWSNWDMAGLMQQIGAMPTMGTGAATTTARGANVHR